MRGEEEEGDRGRKGEGGNRYSKVEREKDIKGNRAKGQRRHEEKEWENQKKTPYTINGNPGTSGKKGKAFYKHFTKHLGTAASNASRT